MNTKHKIQIIIVILITLLFPLTGCGLGEQIRLEKAIKEMRDTER